MVKSSSSIKLKNNFYPEGDNYILFVVIIEYPNGMEERLSLHWIHFSWSGFFEEILLGCVEVLKKLVCNCLI